MGNAAAKRTNVIDLPYAYKAPRVDTLDPDMGALSDETPPTSSRAARYDVERAIDKGATLTNTQRLVLFALLTYTSPTSMEVWPSAGRLAERCGLKVHAVEVARRELRAAGWLVPVRTVVKNRGRLTIYRIQIGKLTEASSPAPAAPLPRPRPAVAPPAPPTPPASPKATQDPPPVARVFAAWLAARAAYYAKTGKPSGLTPKLDDKRRRVIGARLRDFTAADLEKAGRGIWLSQWHVENHETDIALALRDATRVEKFCRIADAPETGIDRKVTPPSSGPSPERLKALVIEGAAPPPRRKNENQ